MSAVQVERGVYRIGSSMSHKGLVCNPYLIVDDQEAVLIDPGALFDFETVIEDIEALIDIEKIKYVILHNPGADVCMMLPSLEAKGLKAKVVTTWMNMTQMQYFGIESEYHIIGDEPYELTFGDQHTLNFLLAPYLPYAGSFVTYDEQLQLLFSSSLFSSFQSGNVMTQGNQHLENLLTYHEYLMPSGKILKATLEVLKTLKIKKVLPHHGTVISEELHSYCRELWHLECGVYLKEIEPREDKYVKLFNKVLNRLKALFPAEVVIDVFRATAVFSFDDDGQISAFSIYPILAWNRIFDEIAKPETMSWLTHIESFVRGLCYAHDLPIPLAYHTTLETADMENTKLLEINRTLDETVKSVHEKLVRCPVTELYNENFLMALLVEEFNSGNVGTLVTIAIDDFVSIQLRYDKIGENDVLHGLSYLLTRKFGEDNVYRLSSADFALYLRDISTEEMILTLDEFKRQVELSVLFIEPITISMGVVFPKELTQKVVSYEQMAEGYVALSLNRLRRAPGNKICFRGYIEEESVADKSILIVDTDKTNLEILKTFIELEGIRVFTAFDGDEALTLARQHMPQLIISETLLTKMDGYVLREALLSDSMTQNIEMMFLSYNKDEDGVQRALGLGITQYLKKPYMMSELVGIVKKHLNR